MLNKERIELGKQTNTKKNRRSLSFAISLAINLLVILLLLAWIYIDSQFDSTLFAIRFRMGLLQQQGFGAGFDEMIWQGMSRRNALGPRIFTLGIFILISGLSGVFIVGNLIVRRTLVRLLLVTLAISLWFSLWKNYNVVKERFQYFQAKQALSGIEPIGTLLATEWPAKSGQLPTVGEFTKSTRFDNLILLSTKSTYAIREGIGSTIERLEFGAICFSLSGAVDCQIEFFPDQGQPESHFDILGSKKTIVSQRPLDRSGKWYFVRYE